LCHQQQHHLRHQFFHAHIQVSFAWNGFNNAMISNLGMVLRNILSKKSLVNYKVRACLADIDGELEFSVARP
jgi:hypothetical protein